MHYALTLARYTLIEALRNRLGLVSTVLLGVGLGLAALLKEISLTETSQIQAALIAPIFRLGAVLILSAFVITSQVRESVDKGLELLLSQALPRAHYLVGKLLGHCAAAFLLAFVFSLPLLIFAPAPSVATWGGSLFLELCLTAALSLLAVLTFSHIVVALTIVAGFYVLARTITVFQLISETQLFAQGQWVNKLTNFVVDAIAFALPRFDLYTQTAWLVEPGSASSAFTLIVVQSAVYMPLLVSAALFDFHRKNL